MIYINKEGNIVEHFINGIINILKEKKK